MANFRTTLTKVGVYLLSQLPGIGLSAFSLAALFVTGHIEWGNTLAEARLNEVRQITTQVEEANSLIDKFTRGLALEGEVDPAVVDSLSTNFGLQFSRIGQFQGNLNDEGREVAEQYKSSLTQLKYGILTAKSLQDLEFVGNNLAEMYKAQLRLVPILAAAAGTAPEDLVEATDKRT